MSAQEERPLPPDVRRALDRAAAGIGRTPTTAHPDCVCGKRIDGGPAPAWVGSERLHRTGTKKDCPQHRPEKS